MARVVVTNGKARIHIVDSDVDHWENLGFKVDKPKAVRRRKTDKPDEGDE